MCPCARNPEIGVGEPPTRVRTHTPHAQPFLTDPSVLKPVDLELRHRISLIPPRVVHPRRVVHVELSKTIACTIATVHRQSYQALHLSRSAPLVSIRLDSARLGRGSAPLGRARRRSAALGDARPPARSTAAHTRVTSRDVRHPTRQGGCVGCRTRYTRL